MNAVLRALVWNEVRLRMRRTSTVVAMLAVVAITWAMIPDPRSGQVLMTVADARVLYTSSAMALGSAALGGILFSLAGFYLVRGRVGEDIRSGIGSVIASTQIGNAWFLFSRWLGGVVYLMALVLAFLLTMLACHLLRGEGPIHLWVYLQTYALLLTPLVFFVVGCALLFDSYAPLLGKGGDVLYFFVWVAQLSVMAMIDTHHGELPALTMLDFSGLSVPLVNLQALLHTTRLSIGVSVFKPELAPIVLPDNLWSARAVLLRFGSGALALLPALPAILLFHRFSPDRVKASRAHARRSPVAYVNQWLRPLSVLVRPLFALAARLPGVAGQVVADVALTFAASPLFIAVLIVFAGAECVFDAKALGGLATAAIAVWGVLVADVSTRDFQAGAEDMTGAAPGGIARRYLRQWAAGAVLGWLFTGVVALRWSFDQPLRALALLVGVASLAALASMLGRASRTSRTFVAIFLFWLYVACNAPAVPWLDAAGFNGAADATSVTLYAAFALAALLGGAAYNRYRSL